MVLVVGADAVLAGQALVLAHDVLDVAREHVHGAHDEHLVLAPGDVDARMRAAAFAGLAVHPADVAGGEANHRARALGQRGVDELALLAIGQHLVRNRVDNFDEDLVLDDVQAVFVLAHARAGAVDVGQAEEVVDGNPPQVLDGLTGGLDGAARLAGDDEALHAGEVDLGIVALLDGLLTEQPGIAGTRPHVSGLVLLHRPQQTRARHGADPDTDRSEFLRSDDVGTAHVEGEVHAMEIAVVGAHARLPEQAALRMLEVLEVLLGERAHGGNARRTRGGGHIDHVVFGHGAHLAEEAAHSLTVAFGLLVGEGVLLVELLERFDMTVEAELVPLAMIVGAVRVGEGEFLVEPLELELLQLGTRHGLDFPIVVLLVIREVLLCHTLALLSGAALVVDAALSDL